MKLKLAVLVGGIYQVVEVAAEDTMAYLRFEAFAKFGSDMPSGTKSEDVVIAVGNVRLSRQEEERMLASEVKTREVELCVVEGPSEFVVPEADKAERPLKRVRIDDHSGGNVDDDARKPQAVHPTNSMIVDQASNSNGGEQINKYDKPGSKSDQPSRKRVEQAISTQNADHGGEKGKEPEEENTPDVRHMKYDQVMSQSLDHLQQLKDLLRHPDFCSESRRQEWIKEIENLSLQRSPDTIIGCLGGTGVGKSSLLNALCDEAAVLPTSGSRGCTATVVELCFNRDLFNPSDFTTVYKGQVEFMSLQEWRDELKVLVDQCSVHGAQHILSLPPDDRQNPEIAAAWSKLKEVYGRQTMTSCLGRPKADVWGKLSQENRVVKMLTGENGHPNVIMVEEGHADLAQAKLLLGQLSDLKGKLRRNKKKWAKDFRAKINEFVYRSGKAGDPQSWPLIRKVVLHGPWAVLSTGARLVDLPGVRDANAARAQVAQSYLKNCDKIWIVAPIKRAVDDGTAKELLGEQFKRRLLMDGKYGTVSFICTQTDECEATEVAQDHEDIARSLGIWERMTGFSTQIESLEQEEDRFKTELEDDEATLKEMEEELKDIRDDLADFDGDNNGSEDGKAETTKLLGGLNTSRDQKQEEVAALVSKLRVWQKDNKATLEELQHSLKVLSALVRNEYSTKCLQKDFRSGLEDLTRKDEEELDDTVPAADTDASILLPPLPEDYQLEVHCISANDYLKLQRVKTDSDGPALTFERVEDTQIPKLRAAVHEATACFRDSFATNLASTASAILDQTKLCATENHEVSGSTSLKLMEAFENETSLLDSKMAAIASNFTSKIETKVSNTLHASFQAGAQKAKSAAMATATSWGSTPRRSKHFRGPNQNGLHFSTYGATVRSNGVYKSKSAGGVDLNQELCDPMEKEFSSDWQRIMDGAIRLYLAEAERQVMQLFDVAGHDIVTALTLVGMEPKRLNSVANAAKRASATAIKSEFQAIRQVASDSQRGLHRSLWPKIAGSMNPGYLAAFMVEGGKGNFMRMRAAVGKHVHTATKSMFDEAASQLLQAIGNFIQDLSSMILASSQVIQSSLTSVYSVSWDGQQGRLDKMTPARRQNIIKCRIMLLPDLNRLCQAQDETLKLAGVERKEVEFEVVGVDNWEKRMIKEMTEAQACGAYFDLVDMSDEEEGLASARMPHTAILAVKSEPLEPTPALMTREHDNGVQER